MFKKLIWWYFWEPARPLQRPPGPEMPKKSRKCLLGPPARDPKKSRKSLGDSPGSLGRVSGKCLESVFGVFRDFLETFLGSRGRSPRETFSRLFRHFGPWGPERPLQGAGWLPMLFAVGGVMLVPSYAWVLSTRVREAWGFSVSCCFKPLCMEVYGAKEGSKVGIVGLGGLGVTGVKIAKALDCEVWAISRTRRESLCQPLDFKKGHAGQGADVSQDWLVEIWWLSWDIVGLLQGSKRPLPGGKSGK